MMSRIAFSATAVFATFLAAATAAAPQETTEISGWGTFVDPGQDCRVEEQDGRVTITVPGTHHDLNPLPKFDNTKAPRLLQKVEGDFQMQVKVPAYTPPKPKSSNNPAGYSYVGAGLVIWQDDKNMVRWFRGANGDRGDFYFHPEGFQDGKLAKLSFAPGLRDRDHRIPNKAAYLRLVRRGNRLTFYRSLDGKKWEAFVVLRNLKLNKKLRVGVAAVNATTNTFAPQFEGFQLKDE